MTGARWMMLFLGVALSAAIANADMGLQRARRTYEKLLLQENKRHQQTVQRLSEQLIREYDSAIRRAMARRDLGAAKRLEDELAEFKASGGEIPRPSDEAKLTVRKSYPLTKEKPLISYAGHGAVEIVRNDKSKAKPVGGESCTDYIFAHATSKVRFAVPPRANFFAATGACASDGTVKFKVFLDGVEDPVFESAEVKGRSNTVQIGVRIPAGTKTIDLVADECGSVVSDHSLWANPEFQIVDF